ncbi:MAG: MFS transporter [Candidatus Kaistia colombiensis]|nr:MAG: MFS transporter [Kaistia sp.]
MLVFRHPEQALAHFTPQARWWGLAIILVNVALMNLDTGIVNATLPTISVSLGVDDSAAIWVISAYQIAMVASLLPAASLGELIGLRRVMLTGLSLTVVASLLCFVAPSLTWLVAARALQGMATACILGLSMAMMRSIASAGRLGTALGMNAFVGGVALAVGPLLAGIVLSVANWHWVFLVNSAGALFAMGVSLRHLLPTLRSISRYDIVTAGLCALSLAAIVYGLNVAAQGGAILAVAGCVIGAIALAGLVRRQAGSEAVFLDLELLRQPSFAIAILVSNFAAAAESLGFIVLPFLLQRTFGFSRVEMGLLIMPWPVLAATLAPLSGVLSDRVSPPLLSAMGIIVVAIGMCLLVSAPPAPTMLDVAWRLAICGIGFGLFQSPNMRTVMSSGPIERSSRIGGISSVSRNLGQAAGAALVAGLFVAYGDDGTRAVLWVAITACVLAASLSLLRWSRR